MQQLFDMVEALALTLNTVAGDAMAKAIRDRDWKGLDRVDPPWDTTPEDFWQHQQIKDLLLKVEGLPGAPSRDELEKSCLSEFYRCEAKNKLTNARLKVLSLPSHLLGDGDRRLKEFLLKVKKDIAALLGPLPDIQELRSRFGPGATFCRRFPANSTAEKLSHAPSYTLGAWPYLLDWIGTAWGKAVYRVSDSVWPGGVTANRYVGKSQTPERVRGNRWTSVEKNSFKRRGICVEPALNVYYQLGYGSFLRNRLKRKWGLDLQHGQEVHRRMAREGSLFGHLVTIDLTSASDLIAYELVKLLLPSGWFSVLCGLRSPFTRVNGKWIRLEKFSSMGNGFTFELETLIFHGLVRGLLREKWPSVEPVDFLKGELAGQYGDDCVVPKEIADDVLGLFGLCGFEVNSRKTYTDGPFRESCGGDYLNGVDVRTFKLSEFPDEPQKWISFANGLWSVANPNNHHDSRLVFFRRLHRYCLGNLPSHIRRLKGPEHLGDLVVHHFPADWQAPLLAGGIAYYKGYLPVSNETPWDHFPPCVVLAAALVGVSSKGSPHCEHPVKGYRIRWIGKPKDLRLRRGRPISRN